MSVSISKLFLGLNLILTGLSERIKAPRLTGTSLKIVLY